tara:strand:+ start:659 stop:1579 length:921 start_codon:yes stop_codon:yes gene_type:complete
MYDLSIITSAYNSKNYIDEFIKRTSKVVKEITDSFEIIIVDDYSDDIDEKFYEELIQKNKNIKVVLLNQNYGQAIAITEGIKVSNGRLFYTTDIDLEVNENHIKILYNKILNENRDCIYCVNNNDNSKSIFSKIFKFFFFLFAKIFLENSANLNINSTFIGNEYARKTISRMNFNNNNLSILISKLKNKNFLKIDRKSDVKTTSYTFEKRFQIALDFFLFSSNKLFSKLIILIMLIFSISFIYFIISTLIFLTNPYKDLVPGYFSLISLLILFGTLSTLFAFLSFYLAFKNSTVLHEEVRILKIID